MQATHKKVVAQNAVRSPTSLFLCGLGAMNELTAEEAEKTAAFRKYLADSGVLDFTTQCECPRSWRHSAHELGQIT